MAVFDSKSAYVKMTTQQAWSVDAVGAGSSHSVAIIRRAGAPLHLLLCICVAEVVLDQRHRNEHNHSHTCRIFRKVFQKHCVWSPSDKMNFSDSARSITLLLRDAIRTSSAWHDVESECCFESLRFCLRHMQGVDCQNRTLTASCPRTILSRKRQLRFPSTG